MHATQRGEQQYTHTDTDTAKPHIDAYTTIVRLHRAASDKFEMSNKLFSKTVQLTTLRQIERTAGQRPRCVILFIFIIICAPLFCITILKENLGRKKKHTTTTYNTTHTNAPNRNSTINLFHLNLI